MSVFKPLVSFVILTYNQKDYVVDAIKGAISQDYDNLEIVISDDCSSDNTVQIIEEYLKHVKTKFSIKLIKNEVNQGTVASFLNAIAASKGQYIVAAAGDDISLPNRVTTQLNYMTDTNACVVVSNYELIDQKGLTINKNYSPYQIEDLVNVVFNSKEGIAIHGASAFYDRRLFDSLQGFEGWFLFEDSLMTFVCLYLNCVISKVDGSLVKYRTHNNSLSNSFNTIRSYREVVFSHKKAMFYYQNKYELFIKLLDFFSMSKFDQGVQDRMAVFLDQLRFKAEHNKKNRFIFRLSYLVRYWRNKDFRLFAFYRLFGFDLFVLLVYLKSVFKNAIK